MKSGNRKFFAKEIWYQSCDTPAGASTAYSTIRLALSAAFGLKRPICKPDKSIKKLKFEMPSDNELHQMSHEQLGQIFPIIICEPSEKWPEFYQTECTLIVDSFSRSDIVRIDHIGSTAIPDIKAKPTIDILLQVSKNSDSDEIIEAFKSLGYQYTEQPENPPPHMMFLKGYTINGFKGQAYHVHVRYKGDWDEIRFRDYLIDHKEIAKEYEALKLELADKYRNDREAYTDSKTEWIQNINKLTRK